MRFFHQKRLGKQEINTPWKCACTWRMVPCAGAHEAAPRARNMQFLTFFLSVLMSCDAFKLQMNFTHFVLSSNTF